MGTPVIVEAVRTPIGKRNGWLSELKATHCYPPPITEMTVPEMFRRFGADEWDALRERFHTSAGAREAAE